MSIVIEEFLLSLGFSISKSGISEFNQALTGARNGFNLLAKAAELTAGAVEFSIGKISDSLDKLYFQSQRTKASAENLVAFAYAARQTGTSAESAAQAVENLASKLRRNPGMAQFFANMGINSSDPTKMIEQLQRRLKNLPMFVQLQYADMIGVDEKTWLALGQQGPFREEQAKVAKAMGLDIGQATKAANQLWTVLRSIGMVLESVGMLIVQRLAGPLGAELGKLRDLLIRNSDSIAQGVIYLTKGIVGLVELFIRLGVAAAHAYTVFSGWPPLLRHIIEGIAAVTLVFRTLNLELLANPIFLVIAAFTALLLLMDDYYAYQKHGKSASLFDWGAVDSIADKVKHAWADAGDYIKEHWQWMLDLMSGRGFSLAGPADAFRNAVELAQRAIGLSHREDAPGAAAGSNNQQTANRVAEISSTLAAGGLSREQIAGVLGNLQVESGFNPKAKNASGHVGIAQWDATAQANYSRLNNGAKLEDADVEAQAKFLLWELNNSESASGIALRRTTDQDNATGAYLGRERPANIGTPEYQAELEQRMRDARFWYSRPQSAGHRLWGGGAPTPVTPQMEGPIDERDIEKPLPIPGSASAPLDAPSIRLHAPTINQHIAYNIRGTDPQSIATEIQATQDASNRTLIRNTKGALE